MQVSFYLKDIKASSTRIICRISEGRNYQVKFSTKYSINPKHWSTKSGSWKRVLSAEARATQVNDHLEKVGKKVTTIYNDALEKNIIPDANYFREHLAPQLDKKTLSFWEAWEVYLDSKKQKSQNETHKKLKSVEKHLKVFEEENRKSTIKFSSIGKVYLEDFHLFLSSKRELTNQTSGKYIKFLKGFLNWSYDRNYIKDIGYKSYRVKGQSDTLKVILTDAELEKIRSYDFKEKNYLLNASKLLLLSCYTGLRFSDYSTIKREHLKEYEGQPYLSKPQVKTGDEVEIPLSTETKKIVDQILDGSIRIISNQKMNDYAKELCKAVEIDEPFEKVTYRGNVKESSTHPKHELVSTHTGRRTFATSLLNKGVSPEVVMTFTGHKSYSSFAKYVNIPKHTKMEIVRKALLGDTMRVA